MSEPTKEAIEEALADEVFMHFELEDSIAHMRALDALITHVRKRAREDALEAAIVTGGIWVQAAYIAQFNASLRALKTQGDTQ